MTKRVFIIHGWGGSPEEPMHKWLKEHLENKEYEVHVPEMPHPDNPTINAWTSHLKKIVKNPDKDTYFIGHSIGCQTIMRYIEGLPENVKLGKVVFIAGWFKLDNLESEEEETIAKPWMQNNIDFNKIKNKIEKLLVFLSDNEPYGFVEENAKMFKEKLNAKVIIEHEKGHFTADDGVTEFPFVLRELQ